MAESAELKPAVAEPISGKAMLLTWGWVFVVAGLGLGVWAFNFEVGVATSGNGYLPSRVANLDLVAFRDMLLTSGAAVFVSGWVMIGASQIIDSIERTSLAPGQPEVRAD